MLHDFGQIVKFFADNSGAPIVVELIPTTRDPDTFERTEGASTSHTIPNSVMFSANSPTATTTGIQFVPGGVFEADDMLLFVATPVVDSDGASVNLDVFRPGNDRVRITWMSKEFHVIKEWLDYEDLGGYRAYVLSRERKRA